MKNIICVLGIIFLAACSGQKDNKKTIQKTPLDNSEEQWIVYYTKDSIPKLLNDALVKLHKGNFKLANPDERFNATDNILDSLPRQQLRHISKKGDQWRLTYVQGGFGKYNVYVQCEIKNDSIYNLSAAESLLSLEHNDSIDKYLAGNELIPKYVLITQ